MKLQEAKQQMKQAVLEWTHQRGVNEDENFFTLLAFLEGAFLKLYQEMNLYASDEDKFVFNELLAGFLDEEPGPGVVFSLNYLYSFCKLMQIRVGSIITLVEGYIQDPRPDSEESLDRLAYSLLWDSRVIRDRLTDYEGVFPR